MSHNIKHTFTLILILFHINVYRGIHVRTYVKKNPLINYEFIY